MITPEEIRARVAKIALLAARRRRAHSEEDALRTVVLETIAAGTCVDPAACAREVLRTAEIKFARWCA